MRLFYNIYRNLTEKGLATPAEHTEKFEVLVNRLQHKPFHLAKELIRQKIGFLSLKVAYFKCTYHTWAGKVEQKNGLNLWRMKMGCMRVCWENGVALN